MQQVIFVCENSVRDTALYTKDMVDCTFNPVNL